MLTSNPQYTPKAVGANSTTQIKKGAGLLGVFIPSVNGTIAAYDNAAGATSGGVIMAATTCTAGTPMQIGLSFITGLTVVTAGGAAGSVGYN